MFLTIYSHFFHLRMVVGSYSISGCMYSTVKGFPGAYSRIIMSFYTSRSLPRPLLSGLRRTCTQILCMYYAICKGEFYCDCIFYFSITNCVFSRHQLVGEYYVPMFLHPLYVYYALLYIRFTTVYDIESYNYNGTLFFLFIRPHLNVLK